MRGKTASPSQAFRGRAGKLSFSGRKTGISGQGNAGGTADTSGGRVRLQDKDSEKCYAKAAENISEHGNSGRNSAGSFVVVISYNIWENCLENGYVRQITVRKEAPLEVSIIFKIAAVGILVSVLSQVLKHSGREEQAFLVSLAGLLVVLFWIVPYIYELFDSIKKLFEL